MNRAERRRLGLKLKPYAGMAWWEIHALRNPLPYDVRTARVKQRLESGKKPAEDSNVSA